MRTSERKVPHTVHAELFCALESLWCTYLLALLILSIVAAAVLSVPGMHS